MDILLIFIVCLNILLGAFVYLQDTKSLSNILFSLMSILASLWTFANYMIHEYMGIFWIASSYSLGALVISTGLLWTLTISGKKIYKKTLFVCVSIAIFFFFLPYKNNFIPPHFQIISQQSLHQNQIDWAIILYSFFYIYYGLTILYILFRSKIKFDKNKIPLTYFKYILLGASITLSITAINSFLLPFLSIYISKGIDSFGFFVFLLFVTIAISKHKLFKPKIIALELILFTLLTFILTRSFLSLTLGEQIFNLTIFFCVLAFGALLLQSLIINTDQQEKIRDLTLKLESLFD